jgi:hypothetical protein
MYLKIVCRFELLSKPYHQTNVGAQDFQGGIPARGADDFRPLLMLTIFNASNHSYCFNGSSNYWRKPWFTNL